MSKLWVQKFDTKIFYAFAVLSLAAAALFFAAKSNTVDAQVKGEDSTPNMSPAATFPGTNTGDIPDGLSGTPPQFGAPRTINFAVSGMTAPLTAVSVDVTLTHTWVGDVEMILAAPGGSPSLVTASRIGVTTAGSFGDSSNYQGAYTFTDAAAGTNIWTIATNAACGDACVVAPNLYRTTGAGQTGQTNPPPVTNLTATFSGLTAPQINGTWTLTLRDAASADTGTVTAANLILTSSVVTDANIDFNGDGKTDFVVARGTNTPFGEGAIAAQGARELAKRTRSDLDQRIPRSRDTNTEAPLAPPIFWYTSINGTGAVSGAQWGDAATDFITPEDFDGDGRDDITVWRDLGSPGAQGTFYILQSQTGTARIDAFGLSGDDPAVVGDYDGDNKADPAVYRCPGIAEPDGQCFFFYRGSNANPGGNIAYVPWGFGVDGDFFPLIGDFDGDGKYDFCIQRSNPGSPSNGQFVLLKSNGFGVEYINWGLSSDFLIPGDYDGDGKSDIMVRRTVSGARQHWLLTRQGAQSTITFGITGDASVPGDYDGDGRTDLAIWRGNANNDLNNFWVQSSSTLVTSVFEWGQCPTVSTCDFPVAGWAVH